MEPNFEDPANKLLSDIVEALRLRYTYQNDIPKPMLNSPVADDTVGQQWLQKVLTRLQKSWTIDKKIPMLFKMTDENERLAKEKRGAI